MIHWGFSTLHRGDSEDGGTRTVRSAEPAVSSTYPILALQQEYLPSSVFCTLLICTVNTPLLSSPVINIRCFSPWGGGGFAYHCLFNARSWPLSPLGWWYHNIQYLIGCRWSWQLPLDKQQHPVALWLTRVLPEHNGHSSGWKWTEWNYRTPTDSSECSIIPLNVHTYRFKASSE